MLYADIAVPNPVRQLFTYGIGEEHAEVIHPGMRVWIPYGPRKTIGMVVKVHDRKPDFRCRKVLQVLDSEPLVTPELMELCGWIARYYYASLGEVIQAALPAGLNYVADRFLRFPDTGYSQWNSLSEKETQLVHEVQGSGERRYEEAVKVWGASIIRSAIKSGALELLELPRVKVKPVMVKALYWHETHRQALMDFLRGYTGKMHLWLDTALQLHEMESPVVRQDLVEQMGFSPFALNRLVKQGFAGVTEMEQEQADRLNLEHAPDRLRALNPEQHEVYEPIRRALQERRFESFLLYGVTGSGKTEVYIHALRDALQAGRGGLVLVPEIALTPQTVRRFYEIFGDDIAVLHSRLNDRERFEAWRKLRNGTKRIAIGARSAIFAPVRDLGIIIVDEEHDQSYKQEDPAPRYNARDVAVLRASLLSVPVVLGSATPGMGTLHAVTRKKHTMLRLSGRHQQAVLPPVTVLDLKQYRNAMKGPLAVPLHNAVAEALRREEQVILLHNRRGYASYQQCDECGHVPECPNCSVSLTYHRRYGSLRCHYCGYSKRVNWVCDKCASRSMDYRGSGTQQVEDELTEIFPDARILRMDRDTTGTRDAHAQILNAFGRHEADILVGTQLVAKGLDFPNVTVVGVVNADTELAFPSYRSAERMFQLLTQVAGRSGRAEKPGVVFLQTRQPEHPALQFASRHDFEGFARFELQQRKSLNYPPFWRLIQIQFKSEDEQRVARIAEVFSSELTTVMRGQHVLGPAPAAVVKVQNDFRWETLVKMSLDIGPRKTEALLDEAFDRFSKHELPGASTVRINVNIDYT
jgi:primosomal protein N' (replication factor Y) (superfamily II helicase)